MIGERLAHYEITAELGRGGMGAVYRAVDTRLDREVAIKILPDVFAQDPDRLARFSREAKVLASLDHPSIGAIYGVEEFDGRHCLILQLVEGETLAEQIASGPLVLGKALAIAKQMAEALAAAHERGVIHRDLKPGNIKVVDERTVKVLDFGLAKLSADDPESKLGQVMASTDSNVATIAGDSTQPGTVLKTLSYMSPEQARGLMIDQRTDIWAFGCCLFEMLTGKKPFAAEAPDDLLAEIMKEEPDWNLLPSETPAAVLTLIRRCLDKECHRRLSSAADIAITLEETSYISQHGTSLLSDESGKTSATSSPGSFGSTLKLAAGGVVVLGFVYALFDLGLKWRNPSVASVGEVRSIAVLPFDVLGGDTELEIVVRGLEAHIREDLGRIDALDRNVGARSVKEYADSSLDERAIASELGVDGLVYGSIRQLNGELEATLQLVHGPTAHTFWTTNISHAKPLVLKDQITLSLLGQFKVPLESDEVEDLKQSDSVGLETYRLYQEGLRSRDLNTANGFTKAIESFQAAIDRSPQFLPAYVALSQAHWLPPFWGGHTPSGKVGTEAAKAVMAAAAERFPGDVRVELTQGFLAMIADFNWVQSKQAMDHALEVGDEDSEVFYYYGCYLMLVEARYQDALRAFERAVALSPERVGFQDAVAEAHTFLNRNEVALARFQAIREEEPNRWGRRLNVALSLKRLGIGDPTGDWLDEALAEAQAGVQDSLRNPALLAVLAEIHAARSEMNAVESLLNEIEQQRAGGQFVPSAFLARVEAQRGNLDRAVEHLRRGFEGQEGFSLLYHSRQFDLMSMLGDHKGYWDLLDEFNFPSLPLDHPFYEQERTIRFRNQMDFVGSTGSLAVLSFVPDGEEALKEDWLAETFRDELIRRFARLEGFESRLVRGEAREEATELGRLARSLKVDGLLYGRFSLNNSQVHVVVERFDSQTGISSIVGNYSSEISQLEELFAAISIGGLDSLGYEVSDQVRSELSVSRDLPAAALVAYRQGIGVDDPLSRSGMSAASERFSEALRLDPSFVAPYLKLAELTWKPTIWGQTQLSAEQAFVQVKALLASAGRFGANDPELMLAQGVSALVGDWDWARAYRHLSDAMEAGRPSAALAWYLLSVEGRYSDAQKVIAAVLSSEPLNVEWRVVRASLDRHHGLWEKATAEYESIGPSRLDWRAALGYAEALTQVGRADEALDVIERASLASGDHPVVMLRRVEVLMSLGRKPEALKAMSDFEAGLDEELFFPSASKAGAYLALGEVDKALDALELGYMEKGSWSMLLLRSAKLLNALGSQPRYWNLVAAMALPELPVYHPASEMEQSHRRTK